MPGVLAVLPPPPVERARLEPAAGRKDERPLATRQPARSITAMVLAAGAGRRMRSATPKVLHEVCGRPSLWYVLKATMAARPAFIVVVVGHGKELVEQAVRSWRITPDPVFVDQGRPLGTGHAVLAAEDAVSDVDDVLVMRRRILDRHMAHGVTFVDPDTAYVDSEVRIGSDTMVQPSTFLHGRTRVGVGCRIGPYVRIVDSTVGDQAEVTFAEVRQARIGARANVGPFASIRPGTVLDEGAKAGTFVEIKASRGRKGSKGPHFSYVGDCTLGREVNVGAGTITANYDGFEKHATVIGDEVHVGSDTMLIAPVKVGKRAWTGAGSVITRDVPAGALAVERSEQRTVLGYDERKRTARTGRKGKVAGKKTDTKRGGRSG